MPLLALILLAPLAELMVLIEIGSELGGLTTLGLCLATAATGLAIVRYQGMGVLAELQQRQDQHAQNPAAQNHAAQNPAALGSAALHGFFLLVAGAFLMIPGFISDSFGALLLFPAVRHWLGMRGVAAFWVQRGGHAGGFTSSTHTRSSGDDSVVDADYRDMDSDPSASPASPRLTQPERPDAPPG